MNPCTDKQCRDAGRLVQTPPLAGAAVSHHPWRAARHLPPIPAAVRSLLSRLPQHPASAAMAAALTVMLGATSGAGIRAECAGKIIRLVVTDAGIRLTFLVTHYGFAPCASDISVDLTLAATAADFLALALRREDPDTLFFSRRLVMEGDTELGLLVKNTLDALEFKPALPAPRNVLHLLRSMLP